MTTIIERCRVCLKHSCQLVEKFVNPKHTQLTNCKFIDILQETFPDLTLEHYFGYKLCNACAKTAEDMYAWKLGVIESTRIYRNYVKTFKTMIATEKTFKMTNAMEKRGSELKIKVEHDESESVVDCVNDNFVEVSMHVVKVEPVYMENDEQSSEVKLESMIEVKLDVESEEVKVAEMDESGNSATKNKVTCECGKLYPNLSKLRIHQRSHTGEKPYQCMSCDKAFPSRSDFCRHQRMHKGERPFRCDLCGRGFSQSGKLEVHRRLHTGEKPFQCQFCDKAYIGRGNLLKHERVHYHAEDKPFKCESCDKAFIQACDLRRHERLHTGEKPFVCRHCGKAFSDVGHLKEHERIHTGEKPFKCDYCDKTFTHSSSLLVHKQIHERVKVEAGSE